MNTTVRPATEGQISFIKSLIAERDISQEWDGAADSPSAHSTSARVAVEASRELFRQHGFVPFDAAKLVIEYLKAAPRKASDRAQAEPGFYVLADGTGVKVQANRAGTGTYALVWGGTSWDYAPGLGRRLAGMTPMTGEQAAVLGLASGRCIACSKVLGGESLSARVAAVVGYGETCAANNGWAFPKGASDQRAFLAAATSCEAVA
jgi:hypothetical protein